MELELKNCIKEINSIANDFVELINYIDKEKCNEISLYVNQNVINLTNIEKPKIMMCGIYDAGKSTLINALMKKEVAVISDRPETFRIDEYDNGAYILVDSPGVDAPIEHEKITNQYLNKCHIIFFVVSTKGTFESQTNYKYMYDFIKSDIPFVIILNDKDGIMERDYKEIINIKHKIIENLKKISQNPNIDRKYQIIVVNAKRALKGAIENKKNLYKKSRIYMVEDKINEIIQKNNALEMLLMPINNMNSIINEAEKEQISKLSQYSDKNYEKYIESLNIKRDNILNEICIDIRGRINSKKEILINKYIEQGNFDRNEIIDQTFDEISNAVDIKLENLSRYISKNFKELDIKIDKKCNISSNIQMPDVDIKIDKNSYSEVNNIKNKENISFKSASLGVAGNILNNYPDVISKDFNRKKGLFSIIDKIDDFLHKDERKWEQYVEETQIKNQAEINRATEEIRIRQDVRTEVENILYNISNEIINEITDEIIRKFDYIVMCLTNCVSINNDQKEFIENNLNKLRELRKRLNLVKNQIV